jgi:hypothetical protein
MPHTFLRHLASRRQEQRVCRGLSFQELYDKGNQLVTAQRIKFMYSSLTDVIKEHMLIVHHTLKVRLPCHHIIPSARLRLA